MLAILVITLIAGSLLMEWAMNYLLQRYEIVWWRPTRREVKQLARTLQRLVTGNRKPMRLVKAERQMNGLFNDTSDEMWLKHYHQ